MNKSYIYQSDNGVIVIPIFRLKGIRGIFQMGLVMKILSINTLIIMLLLILLSVNSNPILYKNDSSAIDREWTKLGYDDQCSYYYPRPSATFEPADSPFDVIIDEKNPYDPQNSIWPWIRTGNLDDDDDLEIVVMGNDTLFAMEKDSTLLWERELPKRSVLNLVDDVEKDGMSEIFVSTKGTDESQATMSVFNNLGIKIKEIVFKNENVQDAKEDHISSYDFMTEVWAVKDLNNDGRKEIYIALHTGYDAYPRGLVCVDYDSGMRQWYFPEAAHITNVIFPDLDGDGDREIVFGTTASKNLGVNPSTNTNDLTSYVFALDHRGREFWRYQVSPRGQLYYYYTMVASTDVDKDGYIDIIGYKGVQMASETTEEGRIFFLNRNGIRFDEEIQTDHNWLKPAGLFDLDNDGNMEAVVQTYVMEEGKTDHLLIVDLSTKEIEHDIEIPGTEEIPNTFMPAGINDLNGDGELEIVICTHNNSHLMVFDHELDLIWDHNVEDSPGMAIISDIIPGGVNEILVVNDRIRLFSLDIDVELDIVHPLEDTLKIMPGDEVEFRVRLENTGNQSWIVEMAMIQECLGIEKFLESRIVKIPEPGRSQTFSFFYTSPEGIIDTNISIVINSTYVSNGIKRFDEEVTWRVLCFDRSILKRLVQLSWECDDEMECGHCLHVRGDIGFSSGPDWDMDQIEIFLRKRSRSSVHVFIDDEKDVKEIPPTGGDFFFQLEGPEDPGYYQVRVEIVWENIDLSVSDSKDISVKAEEERNYSNYLLIIPVAVLLGSIASLGFLLKKKKYLLAAIPPFFHRPVRDLVGDHPTRKKIHQLVSERPGIQITDIMNELGIKNRNNVQHHLEVLEKREMIKSKRDPLKPKIRLYFAYELPVKDPVYLSQGEQLIIRSLTEKPGWRRRDIARVWPYSQPYLTKCIDELNEKGIIRYNKLLGDMEFHVEEIPKEVRYIIDEMEGPGFDRRGPPQRK